MDSLKPSFCVVDMLYISTSHLLTYLLNNNVLFDSDRFVEPFTSAADCQSHGPKFAAKNSKRLLQAAERAEKMLVMSASGRIKALGLKPESPSVVLEPLTPEQLSPVSPTVIMTDDTMTDAEPDSDTQTEIMAVTSTKSKKKKKASTNDSAPARANGGQKTDGMKQLEKPGKKRQSEKRNYSDKNKNVSAGKTGSIQEDIDKPQTAAGFPTIQAEQRTEGSKTLTGKKNSSDKTGIASVGENGLPASVKEAKKAKIPKSEDGKKKSDKSGDVSTSGRNDDTGNVEKLRGSVVSMNDALANMNRKRKASNDNVDDTHEQSVECSSLPGIGNVSVGENDRSVDKPQVADLSSLSSSVHGSAGETTGFSGPHGGALAQGILQRGMPIRGRGRQFANVGNRLLPAENTQRLVHDGGIPVFRGRGRARPRGSGSVGAAAGRGARGGASTRGMWQTGMPVRGRGRAHVVGNPFYPHPEMTGASVSNIQLMPNSASECHIIRYFMLYFIHCCITWFFTHF